jgi:amino acid permease
MHWVSAGLIIYSFAAPSSITGVAYTFAHGGLALGCFCCFICTAASAFGAQLLLDVILSSDGPTRHNLRMLSDVGTVSLGHAGATCCLVLQMLNFQLYQPIALLITAETLQDAVQPSGRTCTNYFIFSVAFACFVTTQLRELRNTALLAGIALATTIVAAALQLWVVYSTLPLPEPRPEPARWAGPPAGGSGEAGWIEMALSLTACAWSYVPSLLVAELAHEMERPAELRKSIWLSAALNVIGFVGVGLPIASAWGASVEDPVTRSLHWPKESASARLLSALLCVANFVAYCLDSVPLARWCQRRFLPHFKEGDWGAAAIGRYALCALPPFVVGLVASVFVGQPGGLFTMLAWTTALTVPGLNMVLPAVMSLSRGHRGGSACARIGGQRASAVALSPLASQQGLGLGGINASSGGGGGGGVPPPPLGDADRVALVQVGGGEGGGEGEPPLKKPTMPQRTPVACAVAVVGVAALAVCFYGAFGKTLNASVRGPQVIGCVGWEIYHSNGTHFHGW